ncbi:MAG: PEFG-CTERM sorting domain-containing protein [Nitrosopumilus sp.]|nr:PEFG-CTERM sorting domain-containing protein [Nitrosopumilus sp.]MDA7942384.1 PEFG-CTERM sorting domain-containing protein [Nitrosopumilus sp.]
MKAAMVSLLAVLAVTVGVVGPAFADHPEVRIKSEGGTSTACVETDTCFEPSSVTVEVGATVIMENTESPDIPILHTFTHGEAPPNQLPADERAFDSGFLAAGQSYEWVPDTPGEYPYFCLAHPWMLGMITVVAAGETHGDGMTASNENTNMSDEPDPSMEADGNMEAMQEGENMGDAMPGDGMEQMQEGEAMSGDGMMDGQMMGGMEMTDEERMMMDEMMAGMVHELAGGELMVAVDVHSEGSAAGDQVPVTVAIVSPGNAGAMMHYNYRVTAMQMGEMVIDETVHSHDGVMEGDLTTAPLPAAISGEAPLDVSVEFLGFGIPGEGEFTGPGIGEMAQIQEVPEFGVIAVVVLGAAVVAVIAVTSRSRITLTA